MSRRQPHPSDHLLSDNYRLSAALGDNGEKRIPELAPQKAPVIPVNDIFDVQTQDAAIEEPIQVSKKTVDRSIRRARKRCSAARKKLKNLSDDGISGSGNTAWRSTGLRLRRDGIILPPIREACDLLPFESNDKAVLPPIGKAQDTPSISMYELLELQWENSSMSTEGYLLNAPREATTLLPSIGQQQECSAIPIKDLLELQRDRPCTVVIKEPPSLTVLPSIGETGPKVSVLEILDFQRNSDGAKRLSGQGLTRDHKATSVTEEVLFDVKDDSDKCGRGFQNGGLSVEDELSMERVNKDAGDEADESKDIGDEIDEDKDTGTQDVSLGDNLVRLPSDKEVADHDGDNTDKENLAEQKTEGESGDDVDGPETSCTADTDNDDRKSFQVPVNNAFPEAFSCLSDADLLDIEKYFGINLNAEDDTLSEKEVNPRRLATESEKTLKIVTGREISRESDEVSREGDEVSRKSVGDNLKELEMTSAGEASLPLPFNVLSSEDLADIHGLFGVDLQTYDSLTTETDEKGEPGMTDLTIADDQRNDMKSREIADGMESMDYVSDDQDRDISAGANTDMTEHQDGEFEHTATTTCDAATQAGDSVILREAASPEHGSLLDDRMGQPEDLPQPKIPVAARIGGTPKVNERPKSKFAVFRRCFRGLFKKRSKIIYEENYWIGYNSVIGITDQESSTCQSQMPKDAPSFDEDYEDSRQVTGCWGKLTRVFTRRKKHPKPQ